MDNGTIAKQLRQAATLLELTGGNRFKAAAYDKAARAVKSYGAPVADLFQQEEPPEIEGVGGSMAEHIREILNAGTFAKLDELRAKVPEGVREMTRLPGLGAKKIRQLWQEIGVEDIETLRDHCATGKLGEYKGFGAKTQQSILEAIDFLRENRGKLLLHYAAAEARELAARLALMLPAATEIAPAGALRRACPVLDAVELLAVFPEAPPEDWVASLQAEYPDAKVVDGPPAGLAFATAAGDPVRLYATAANDAGRARLALDAEGPLNEVLAPALAEPAATEAEAFARAGLNLLPPERRDAPDAAVLAKTEQPALLWRDDLKGAVHAHSTWSDGADTVERMAQACVERGYDYLLLTDHSRSAFYAGGLDAKRVAAQHKEIDALNERLAPFRIFKGIESDILNDGSLDYPDEILQTFDGIIASVHSGLKMDETRATERLVGAVMNPYTRILGHPTARLLTRREGYPIDHRAAIDACAEYGVAIELNCNPYRMDLDWTWLDYARERGVLIAICPDAHSVRDLDYADTGCAVARKGGLRPEETLNALPTEAFAAWLARE